MQFRFWYNMKGKDIGTLEVFQVTSYLHPDEVIMIDSLTGEQGDYWQLREVPIPSRGKDFDVSCVTYPPTGMSVLSPQIALFTTHCIARFLNQDQASPV